jgi:hypothetical protein
MGSLYNVGWHNNVKEDVMDERFANAKKVVDQIVVGQLILGEGKVVRRPEIRQILREHGVQGSYIDPEFSVMRYLDSLAELRYIKRVQGGYARR